MKSSSPSMALRPPDATLPVSYWNELTQEDKAEFIRLRNQFHQNQKISVKDGRLVSFHQEMVAVLHFLERCDAGREQRSILAGIAFAGTFICVNTRQLKSFLGRCKSSINGSLQQLGYVAVKTKSKARQCVLSLIPRLQMEPVLLRQWTVRGASRDALYCFVPKCDILSLPKIIEEDLFDDKKIQQHPVPRAMSRPIAPSVISDMIRTVVSQQLQNGLIQTNNAVKKQNLYDFDLSAYEAALPDRLADDFPDMTPSFSMEIFSEGEEWDVPSMTRSRSAFLGAQDQDLLGINILMFD